RPKDFDLIARMVGREEIAETVAVSAELGLHAERIARYSELAVDTVYLHNVGANQRQFLEAFGAKVLPQLSG
ncbi:MAG TPA: LLM class F420-dependent oxidoreductase, partial [Devosia sp.]